MDTPLMAVMMLARASPKNPTVNYVHLVFNRVACELVVKRYISV